MSERRLQEIQRHLETSSLDAFLVSHLPHVRYLSGFSGSNGLCLITRRRSHFFTDPRYREQARGEARTFAIHVSRESFPRAVLAASILRGKVRVGIESQYLSVAGLRQWKNSFRQAAFVPTTHVIEAIAAVKDESEIEHLRQAAAISDRIFGSLLRILKPGIAELDVSAEISYWNKRLGAEGDAFEPIVASGVRGALPHGRASGKKIRNGEFVTLDFGTLVKGYHSDLTRTVAVGKPSPRLKSMYALVLKAQRRAIDAAEDGVRASTLDQFARTIIRKGGLGRYFTHSLGHGLGIEIHEPLRLSAQSKEILESGNVVTVEPGVYIPGVGGVRIEDDIVIRHNGCEVLNRAPKELIVL